MTALMLVPGRILSTSLYSSRRSILRPNNLCKVCSSIGTRLIGNSTPILRPRHAPELSELVTEDEGEILIQDPGNYEVIFPPEPYIFGTSHITPRIVPPQIPRPPYVLDSGLRTGSDDFSEDYSQDGDGRIQLGSEDEVRLRKAARLARKVLNFAGTLATEGVTTDEIDEAVHEFIVSQSAYPSPLHYNGFPKACCTSVNNIVTHGIPDDRPLRDGDIVNIDITVYLNGFHGDTSRTFLVGNVDQVGQDLVQITNEALEMAISSCGPGKPFNGIAKAIHKLLIKNKNYEYSVCRQFTGHGIGRMFHRPPWIFHDVNDDPGEMLPGHCFTIEPCIVQGTNPRAWTFPDGWTSSTESAARSAQAEHMVLITERGYDILTKD